MSKKCAATSPPHTVPESATSSCYDLVSMLEHQLRTARALLDELTQRSVPGTQSTVLVVDYCADLRAEAVEVVSAAEMLQREVCSPAYSLREMNAHKEIDALLDRISGLWAQLPGVAPGSKPHAALLEKIHIESAAYLKLADAARGVDRMAESRANAPIG